MIDPFKQSFPVYLNTVQSVISEPEIPQEFIKKGELTPHDIALIKESVIAAKKQVFEKVIKKLNIQGAVKLSEDQASFNAKVAHHPQFNQTVSQRHSQQLHYEFHKVAEKVEELRPAINWRKKEGEVFSTWLGINYVTKREVSLWNSRGDNLYGAARLPDAGEKAYKRALRAEIAALQLDDKSEKEAICPL